MRTLLFAITCSLSAAIASAQPSQTSEQTQRPTLFWEWTAMYPALPPGTVQTIGQLDGVGADEIAIYHPPTGQAWIVWVGRDMWGMPEYCYEAHQFPAGFASVGIGRFDAWRVDGSDQRADLVLFPHAGPLYFATTYINRAGRCYTGE